MAGPRYIADSADELKAVPLGGLVAIFHRPSGITHLLAPPAPQILEALASAPADEEVLLARIEERFDVEGGAEALVPRLAELEAAGLVRRA
nr:HPr-rel-A system PqqD family peptide chaperone [uncultured Sphingosinicella sp.]